MTRGPTRLPSGTRVRWKSEKGMVMPYQIYTDTHDRVPVIFDSGIASASISSKELEVLSQEDRPPKRRKKDPREPTNTRWLDRYI